MGISGYTSVTIHAEKYKKIRADFEKHIKDKIDKTFTGWVTDLMENSIDRAIKIKAMFPHLAVVKILDHGLIIEDMKNDAVVKVIIKDKKIMCTDSSEKSQQYISCMLLCIHSFGFNLCIIRCSSQSAIKNQNKSGAYHI